LPSWLQLPVVHFTPRCPLFGLDLPFPLPFAPLPDTLGFYVYAVAALHFGSRLGYVAPHTHAFAFPFTHSWLPLPHLDWIDYTPRIAYLPWLHTPFGWVTHGFAFLYVTGCPHTWLVGFGHYLWFTFAFWFCRLRSHGHPLVTVHYTHTRVTYPRRCLPTGSYTHITHYGWLHIPTHIHTHILYTLPTRRTVYTLPLPHTPFIWIATLPVLTGSYGFFAVWFGYRTTHTHRRAHLALLPLPSHYSYRTHHVCCCRLRCHTAATFTLTHTHIPLPPCRLLCPVPLALQFTLVALVAVDLDCCYVTTLDYPFLGSLCPSHSYPTYLWLDLATPHTLPMVLHTLPFAHTVPTPFPHTHTHTQFTLAQLDYTPPPPLGSHTVGSPHGYTFVHIWVTYTPDYTTCLLDYVTPHVTHTLAPHTIALPTHTPQLVPLVGLQHVPFPVGLYGWLVTLDLVVWTPPLTLHTLDYFGSLQLVYSCGWLVVATRLHHGPLVALRTHTFCAVLDPWVGFPWIVPRLPLWLRILVGYLPRFGCTLYGYVRASITVWICCPLPWITVALVTRYPTPHLIPFR